MKILHTSDWHVGKILKGQSRVEEQVAVLREIVDIAAAERPDLIIVAGDLYETAAPTADTKKIVVRALSALRRHASAVVVIAGNHDHGAEIDALRPWADEAGITLRGSVGKAEDHLVSGVTEGGEAWRMAALPFVSAAFLPIGMTLTRPSRTETRVPLGRSYTLNCVPTACTTAEA